jgi:hypothetical protein
MWKREFVAGSRGRARVDDPGAEFVSFLGDSQGGCIFDALHHQIFHKFFMLRLLADPCYHTHILRP